MTTTEAKAKQKDQKKAKENGAKPAPAAAPQSAAAPSPFTPIADYGFLSNCHTGALVAPDGGIGWLCVPSFDAPSIFGTLLDRQAGDFRLGPFGVSVPAGRVYEPGTNTLITAWHARATVRALPRIRMCMNHTIGCSPHRCWCMACQVMPCLTIWSMAGLSSSGLKHRSPFIMTWSPPMDWK